MAAVGFAYLKRHARLAQWLADAGGFPSANALTRWVTFWLLLHDIGKFALSFQCQRLDLVQQLQGATPPHMGDSQVRHDTLGYWLWLESIERWLLEKGIFGPGDGWSDGAKHWARAFTGHHGQPPIDQVRRLEPHFRSEDIKAALVLVRWAFETVVDTELRDFLAGAGDDFEARSREVALWGAGVAVLADWIGSNSDRFPYAGDEIDDLDAYWALSAERAEAALAASGVLPVDALEQTFDALFPQIGQPSPLQRWASEVSVSAEPSIILLEDVTGAGKTEAAVILGSRLMRAGAADGFFFGLPSMATANAMYGRVAEVFGRLFPRVASLALVHGRKDLVETFARSVLRPGEIEGDPAQRDDTATARCTQWLADHNKRALLAQAGVGTIDQALLAGLQAKHQSLRLLGLFRKVLVVDEVHACDAYMQKSLETLLTLHAHAGGSAILLSATLPQRMKAALVAAFARGRGRSAPTLRSSDYPLATRWSGRLGAADECATGTRADLARRVEVRTVHEVADVLRVIAEAVARRQCVVWIRNTVADVLAGEEALTGLVPAEDLTIFHARFTLADRLAIEDRVLSRFGPRSGPTQRRGQVLIANQVAEQSLDICADVLITDAAPIDRVMQRAGRLHRHRRRADGELLPRGQSDERGTPVLWVLAPEWTEAPNARWFREALPKAAYVYPDHGQLWLTQRELRRGEYRMPDDARVLVEAVFGDEAVVPGGLQGSSDRAMGQAYANRGTAQSNSMSLATGYCRHGIDWMSDRSAPSRLGEATNDLIIARWEGDDESSRHIVPWCDGREHAWEYSTVRVPLRLIAGPASAGDDHTAALIEATRASLPGGGRYALLLVLENEGGTWSADALAPDGRQRRWTYDARRGLLARESGASSPAQSPRR